MNKQRLEAMMKLNGDTGKSLSEYLGISRSTFSAKLNEHRGAEFTQGEIKAIKEKYSLSDADTVDIFFTTKVS